MPREQKPFYSVPDVEKIIENHDRAMKLMEIGVRRLTSEISLLKDEIIELMCENISLKTRGRHDKE